MIALLQRVSQAQVVVEDRMVARIGIELMVLICAERATARQKRPPAERLLN